MTKFRAALASLVLATGLIGGATAATGLLDGGSSASRGGHWCC